MCSNDRGFTLIELIIVITLIAIIAAIAVPNLLSSRLSANEAAAIQTMKSISSAQAQCQASGAIDANSNGTGEFGYLGELSGGAYVRVPGGLSATERIRPPVLSQAFTQVNGSRVVRSGYVFQVFLPDTAGGFVPEAATGGATAGAVDPRNAEVLWCCYAWPVTFRTSGRRAFVVNQRGDLLACSNLTARYEGGTRAPVPGTAGFLTAGSSLASTLAANTIGADGERWNVVN